ncbi:MAG TPA: mercury methylation corrinoid protein HgcA [Sedimentisphaerales bacterium]|nr:mercury methylation corrinoid protein HgcA [Sedimentisphaerales bacterium]
MVEKTDSLSFITCNNRRIPRVPTELVFADRLGGWKARWGINRMKYLVEPGLYAVGNPDADSVVLVSANYKLSFDALRKQLSGLDAWLMVLDTKGVNVWCAAGKGTFGTDEIVRRIELVKLEKIVNHRRIIVPQLAAPGVAAHEVKKRCGFSVVYGPVRAADIIAFIEAGMKATEAMRRVRFSLHDRLVLTPMEFVMGAKYLVFSVALLFILAGLSAAGYSSDLAVKNGVRSAVNLLAAYLGGTVVGPVLLPWLPGRSFSFKGCFVGVVVGVVLMLLKLTGGRLETIAWVLLVAAVASFATMNFTGASTYTSLSGVKKEVRVALPLQVIAAVLGAGMWVASRFADGTIRI